MTDLPTSITTTASDAQQGYVLDGEDTAIVVIKILIYVVGVIGNLLVIFVILFLREYKKITHWYVLQMALADLIFLQNLPFKLTEDVSGAWVHAMWLCSAQQTILFFTYYASILFLMIMAIDRYLAVCHPLATIVQRVRTSQNSYIVAVITWVVALALSIPSMLYSTTVGIDPNCRCTLLFPKDPTVWCRSNGFVNDTAYCVKDIFPAVHGDSCSKPMGPSSGDYDSGLSGSGLSILYGDYLTDDVTTSGTQGTPVSVSASGGLLLAGCYYDHERPGWNIFIIFNFVVMFIVPLVVIITCYSLIVHRLLSSNVSSGSSDQNSGRKIWRPSTKKSGSASSSRSQREKKRVTMLCAILALLFTVFWLPFHSVHLAKIVGIVTDDARFCSRLAVATSILAYLSSATNPYLYNFLGSFKKRMKQIKDSKRMQSFLSATGITGASSRGTSGVGSSEGSKGRNSIAQSHHPGEQIPLKSIEGQ